MVLYRVIGVVLHALASAHGVRHLVLGPHVHADRDLVPRQDLLTRNLQRLLPQIDHVHARRSRHVPERIGPRVRSSGHSGCRETAGRSCLPPPMRTPPAPRDPDAPAPPALPPEPRCPRERRSPAPLPTPGPGSTARAGPDPPPAPACRHRTRGQPASRRSPPRQSGAPLPPGDP